MKHCLIAVLGIALALPSCHTYYTPSEAESRNLRVRDFAPPGQDTEAHPLDEIIAPYKESLDERMNTVIGRANKTLTKQRPESTLGNWMADAMQNQVNELDVQPVDVSIQNHGGIRVPELNEGDVTVRHIYELMPFDNLMVILDLSGPMTQRFFDHMAEDGGWPISSGASYVLLQKKAQQLTIGGEAIQADKVYRIAMPDYIANGGGDCDFLRDIPQENTGMLVRDLLIKEVAARSAAGEPITAKVDGRVRWGE